MISLKIFDPNFELKNFGPGNISPIYKKQFGDTEAEYKKSG